MLAIEELAQTRPSPRRIDAFIEDHEFPIVEGRQVTFVYRGPANGVVLQHWVYALAQEQPFQRLRGTDLWYLTLDLPRNSRIEYKIGLVEGGPLGSYGAGQRLRLIQDPLNPHHALDPYGANSVVHTEGHETPDWTHPDSEARTGEIVEHTVESAVFGGPRPVKVYKPARYRASRRYPLLIVHDGDDFLRFASLQTVLDNLIHRLEIPPMICALTSSPERLVEYANDERHATFLVDELLPMVTEHYSLLDDPGSRGLLGSSFGAIASLAAAWHHPGVFNRLCLLSGSFLFTDIGEHEGGPAFDAVHDFMTAFRRAPGTPARQIFLSCGVYEPMIYYNRSLVPLLQGTGMRVLFSEARDGHNWENWRDRLREGLSWLFPGPLWMVYE
jgi:enterochelin esterase family protein